MQTELCVVIAAHDALRIRSVSEISLKTSFEPRAPKGDVCFPAKVRWLYVVLS